MTLYMLTRASARAAGACYDDARVAALVPPGGLSPAEVAALDIPLEDRVWALTCACGLPRTGVVHFAQMCDARAARSSAAARAARSSAARAYVTAATAAAASAASAARSATASAAFAASAAAARSAAARGYARAYDSTCDAGYAATAAAAWRLAEQQWQIHTLVALMLGEETL
jgi:hypothetical protein